MKDAIVIFAAYINPHLGGIETYIDNLVNKLKQTKYNVIIVTSNFNDVSNFEETDKLTIIRLPIYNLFKMRYPIFKKNKEYKYLMNKLDNYKIKGIIVNTRFHLSSHIGAKYAKKKKLPCFLIEHGSNYITVNSKFWDFFANRYEMFLTNCIKKKITAFYGVSKRCNTWLKSIKIQPAGVLYNAVNEELYIDNKKYLKVNKKIEITYAGRILVEKGVVNLLEAFNKINQNCILNIAGDGPILDDLKKKYKKDNIKFLGRINHDEVIKLMAKTDIFVYPSMYPEGLPTSILEAGLMECAIIATDRGGTTEVINDEKYGIIIEENIDDLEDKLKYLLDNPKIIDSMKKNIHKRIMDNFLWKQTANHLIKEIEKYGK